MESSSSCAVSVYFFFFKQKTAYEMRISDWSSDVCSSDLRAASLRQARPVTRRPPARATGDGSWHLSLDGAHGGGAQQFVAQRVDPVEEIGRASGRERVCQYV